MRSPSPARATYGSATKNRVVTYTARTSDTYLLVTAAGLGNVALSALRLKDLSAIGGVTSGCLCKGSHIIKSKQFRLAVN
eukprot:scaffold648436_cov47-Prasinocladus_malaysianus.AAC.1